jgi:hypothetical protein
MSCVQGAPEQPEGRALSEIPLAPEEASSIDRAAWWMGMLGRFQVLGGGVLALIVIVGGIVWAINQASPAEVASSTTPPLVRLGEVSTRAAAIAGGLVLAFALLFLRGGVLLTDAAEDLEKHASGRSIDAGLRHLTGYYVTEILATAIAIGALATLLGSR